MRLASPFLTVGFTTQPKAKIRKISETKPVSIKPMSKRGQDGTKAALTAVRFNKVTFPLVVEVKLPESPQALSQQAFF